MSRKLHINNENLIIITQRFRLFSVIIDHTDV
jgi:hypothetical protein